MPALTVMLLHITGHSGPSLPAHGYARRVETRSGKSRGLLSWLIRPSAAVWKRRA